MKVLVLPINHIDSDKYIDFISIDTDKNIGEFGYVPMSNNEIDMLIEMHEYIVLTYGKSVFKIQDGDTVPIDDDELYKKILRESIEFKLMVEYNNNNQ